MFKKRKKQKTKEKRILHRTEARQLEWKKTAWKNFLQSGQIIVTFCYKEKWQSSLYIVIWDMRKKEEKQKI